ncbi:MAG TPA: Flp family type IVb pilin [Dehalococcoidia bacterium]|nr:Flp family type IVb pilin [Dehalococcoidia bacterium]
MAAFYALVNAARRIRSLESGQTLVEYGLIVALLALGTISGLMLVAGGTDSLWSKIEDALVAAFENVLA